MVIKRFDIHLVTPDPTIGSEIKKNRPCVVISPDEMNRFIATVIVASMTSKGRPYPSRVPVKFKGKHGHIVLEQIRTIDKKRLVKRLGRIDKGTQAAVLSLLNEMFST